MSDDTDTPFDLPPGRIEYRDEREFERMRAEEFHNAALIGYGALLAGNTDGRYKLVLDAMAQVLFQKPFNAT